MPREDSIRIVETTVESITQSTANTKIKPKVKLNYMSPLTPLNEIHDYTTWTDSKGDKVPLKDMDEEHIVHAMCKICRSFSRQTFRHKPKYTEKFTYALGIGYLMKFALELISRQNITEIHR